jgi:hypothetical protein
MQRICTKCGEDKLVSEFYPRQDGHNSHCKMCQQASSAMASTLEKEWLKKYKDYPRCKECEIVLHDEVCETCEKQHGLSTNGQGLCDDCYSK